MNNPIYTNPVGHWVVIVVAMALLLFVLLTATAYMVLFERVVIGRMQSRFGPNRVGPFGLLQPAADGIKLVLKESFIPSGVDRFTYVLAPAIAVLAALLTWAVIPFGIWYGGFTYWVANLNIGLLLVFALSAMNVYGILLGGWSSNSKYSLLGGLRSSAQLISYEMSLGLAFVPVFMIAGTLRLQSIATFHVGPFPLLVVAPLSFLIYLISAVAETNRPPFDLPEAESELVGGWHTEYSGFKFAMYYLAEYMNVLAASTIAAVVFLGGAQGPLLPPVVWLLLKIGIFAFMYVWLRATLPRLRYDMLMRLGWKVLLPVAILNVIVTAVVLVAVA